ncbi:MAG: adenylyl-sulfate kinase [Akkermansiaceae bacterium]|jgi:sulfate adenylyltransferase|nr:adenylyl-sulfate kinase [Akkermansiaceae bacterium]
MKSNLLVDTERAAELKVNSNEYASHDLTKNQTHDLELLIAGAYKPLIGYLNESDHVSVVNSMHLTDGTLWAKPISLEVDERLFKSLNEGDRLALRDQEGVLLAILSIESLFTSKDTHYLGGAIEGIEMPTHYDHKELRLYQKEANPKVDTVLTFTDLLHKVEVEALKDHIKVNKSKITIQLFASDPIESHSRLRCIKAALSELPTDQYTLSILPGHAPANAKEWLQYAILLKGSGCSSLISDGDISLVKEHSIINVFTLPKGSSEETFDTVLEEINSINPPPKKKGITIFFTGLSGSGKSTIAKILQIKMLELTKKRITLLDGDVVRKNLCSELGFSKDHRLINLQRIGFVANEISKNGGIAICAPIAPYDSIRKEIRKNIEPNAGFILIHVATPIAVCEARDRKGLYAKARSGEIKHFTGISDPYEEPQDAELILQTDNHTAEESCEFILDHLKELGFLELA